MTAVLVGAQGLGGTFPGFSTPIDASAAIFADLHGKAQAVLDATVTAKAAVDAAVSVATSAIATAKASIEIAALADLQAQLDATLAIGGALTLTLTDPAAYISAMLEGNIQVKANIQALVPDVAINAQISVNAALALSLEAKIAAFKIVLNVLLTIGVSLDAAVSLAFKALFLVTAELQVALDAAFGVGGALSLLVDLQAAFALGPVVVYRGDATLGAVAADLDTLINGGATGGLLLTDSVRLYAIAVPVASPAKAKLDVLVKIA